MNIFKDIPEAPNDAIFGVKVKHDASPLTRKELLAVGVYRTDDGKPYVFECVKKAEQKNLNKYDKEYLPMTGDPAFVKAARELLFGDLLNSIGDRVASIQSCAGTGALFLVSKFCKTFYDDQTVLLSDPYWPNYKNIFSKYGHKIETYKYAKNCAFDLDGCIGDINKAKEGSLIVIQACAHNPSGIDPTNDELRKVLDACVKRKLMILFDFAYIGLTTGNADDDMLVLREFFKSGYPCFVCFSFSKCLGLYGERVGCLHVICEDKKQANCVRGQIANIVRCTYSNPPRNGSSIVTTVLTDPELCSLWKEELKTVTGRIISIRNQFVDLLNKKTGKSFEHIRKQRGMFAYTGLTAEQVDRLCNVEGVFITSDGRISVPYLNSKNVEFVAQAIANVVNKSV